MHDLDLVQELLHILGVRLELEQTFHCNSSSAFNVEMACQVAFGMGPSLQKHGRIISPGRLLELAAPKSMLTTNPQLKKSRGNQRRQSQARS